MSEIVLFPTSRTIPMDRTLYSTSCMSGALPADRLTPAHRILLSYWESRRGTREVPRREDIDPIDIRQILPHVMLWDAETDGGYRCRVAGTAIDMEMAGSLKGVRLSDLTCSLIDEAKREFDAVRDGGMASYAERTMGWRGRPFVYYRHLLLPVTNDTGSVHQLIGAMTFHAIPRTAAA
jgi:hypothetical protein